MLTCALLGCNGGSLNSSSDMDQGPQPATDGGLVMTGGPIGGDATSNAPDAGPAMDAFDSDPGPACPRVVVDIDWDLLRLRAEPHSSSATVTKLPDRTNIGVVALALGDAVNGDPLWYKVKSGGLKGFIPAARARCSTKLPADLSGFNLPFSCGKQVTVSQGNNTSFSHNGTSKYAFDFSLPSGTLLRAMAPGKVTYVYDKTDPGEPCYNGGGPSCLGAENRVWIKHADGSQTIYAHLSSVKVKLNQKVARGEVIGRSGNSGYSTGPHLHTGRMKSCCQTIPLKFRDAPGTGVPKTGDSLYSGNCP